MIVFPTCVLCHEDLAPARWPVAHLPCDACTRSIVDATRRIAARHPDASMRWTAQGDGPRCARCRRMTSHTAACMLLERSRAIESGPDGGDGHVLDMKNVLPWALLVAGAIVATVAMVALGLGPAP